MDTRQLRRLAPALFGLAILVCALFARSALVPVCIIGGILLGLMYSMLPRDRSGGRVRERHR